MTTRKIMAAVEIYRCNPGRRVNILRRLYTSGGLQAIEAFAYVAGIDPVELTSWINRYYHARYRRRRGKKPLEPVGPPPSVGNDPVKVREVAEFCVGGYGELRFGRRDATRSTTNKRSRKF